MRRQKIIHWLPPVILVLLISFFFYMTRFTSNDYNGVISKLNQIQQVDEHLNLELLKTRHGLVTHYTGLNHSKVEISLALNSMGEESELFSLCEEQACQDLFPQIRQIFEDKAEQIELFKQRNAVENVALRYFPKSLLELKKSQAQWEHAGVAGDRLSADLAGLAQAVGFYFSRDINNKEQVNFFIARIEASRSSLPEELEKQVTLLLSHTNLLIGSRDEVDAIVGEILTLPFGKHISQLNQSLLLQAQREQKTSAVYQFLLYLTSILLLAYLAEVLIRIRQSHLALREAVKNLEFQKYALDQHAIVSETDVQGGITYVNQKFIDISGYSNEELIGSNHRLVRSSEHENAYFKQMWRTIAQGKVWHGELCNRSKDGTLYWVDSTIVPFLDSAGKPVKYISIRTDITEQIQTQQEVAVLARFAEETPGAIMRIADDGKLLYSNQAGQPILRQWGSSVGEQLPEEWSVLVSEQLQTGTPIEVERQVDDRHVAFFLVPVMDEGYVNIYCRDVTDRKQVEEELNYQASHDSLTGLLNRQMFERLVRNSLEDARISRNIHSLLYLDLDQFKVVNDTCGHVAGDELLRQITQLLAGKIRVTDTLARLGGDEFGLLLMGCNLLCAETLGEKLRRSVSNYRFAWEDKSFEIGVSIGVVLIDHQSPDTETLFSAADVACYAAKDQGRNRLHVYQPDDEETGFRQQEMHWVTRINQALEKDLFELWVQQIKPLQRVGGAKHYEVLLRMRDEQGEISMPGAFIPAAERYGLMNSVDRWVIDNLFNFLSGVLNSVEAPQLVSFAINLSGTSLSDEKLFRFIAQKLGALKIPPQMITFEITETAAISNLSRATGLIEGIRALGCHFSLDDFGSGLSSFGYLKTLPVDFIKIDGSFVKEMDRDEISLMMVQSIHNIGHTMGLKTIAEFVETGEIESMLRTMGIDYAQGYGIEQPKPITQLLKPVEVVLANS